MLTAIIYSDITVVWDIKIMHRFLWQRPTNQTCYKRVRVMGLHHDAVMIWKPFSLSIFRNIGPLWGDHRSPSWFSWHWANNTELCSVLFVSSLRKSVKETSEIMVICDGMVLMWRHCIELLTEVVKKRYTEAIRNRFCLVNWYNSHEPPCSSWGKHTQCRYHPDGHMTQ